ncbi:HAD family hydrolase [Clostridium rectalis]|uniref:HAD family hydrolase n=1 Tax=Clostridium rectalis TaxID=2040295 RepID=UPI000F644B70|nr:HAD family hydrolase [Clostridium rectalis]
MIKWIIFDIDGTLIETAMSNMIGLRNAIKKFYNKEYELEDLRKYMGIPGDEALKDIGVKEEEIPKVWRYWEEEVDKYRHYNYVFNGVKEMLNKLNKKYSLAIVTSKTQNQLRSDFTEEGLLKYFKIWICKEDTLSHKPNPEPLLKALEKANVDVNKAIYIGDAMVDYCAAKKINMKFGHCRFAEKFDDVGNDIIFNTPRDITNYFNV